MSILKICHIIWLTFTVCTYSIETSNLFFVEYLPAWTGGLITFIPPTIGVHVAVQYIFFLLLIFILIDGIDIWVRNTYSPFIMGAGLPHPVSYSGVFKKHSGYVIARGGGAKFPFPHEGTTAIINPLTHAHKIDEDLIIEAEVTPGRPLEEVPADVMSYIRSTRTGLWGTKSAAVGWLSSEEMSNRYVDFKKQKYSISDFLELLCENLINYSTNLQIRDVEAEGVSKKLSLMDQIGKKAFTKKTDSIKERIVKNR